MPCVYCSTGHLHAGLSAPPFPSQVHLADALPILSLPAPLPAHLVLHLLDQPSLGRVQRRLSFGRSLVCPAAHHLSRFYINLYKDIIFVSHLQLFHSCLF